VSSPVRSSTATFEHKDAPATAGASLIAPEGCAGIDNTFGKGRQVYKRGVIRLGYPTQNLAIPAWTNRTCHLASLHDAEKVQALIREK
jgi:hypothetical protein